MARQDGYQLLRRLREAGYGPDVLPAIALTAFSRMKDRNEALQAGFQEHLVSPSSLSNCAGWPHYATEACRDGCRFQTLTLNASRYETKPRDIHA